ncbi:hypothetical protein AAY24_08515 [Sedimenticola thiotaurini]|uniref:Uncharacterized protein n=1 Tax=Sedimenticola thiotaurini TaxID=1543721 RepID=A0A0F7JUZ5_9GAMM|nr:hypothetical protein AAY24_08515 [Sedimenticola thiotaurini]
MPLKAALLARADGDVAKPVRYPVGESNGCRSRLNQQSGSAIGSDADPEQSLMPAPPVKLGHRPGINQKDINDDYF